MVGVSGFRAHASLLLCQVRVGAEQATVCQLPDLWIRRVGNLYVLSPSLIPFGVSPRSYGRLHTQGRSSRDTLDFQ